jgi:hypothetical protein
MTELPERDELAALRQAAAARLDVQTGRAERFLRYYDGEQDVLALMDTDERRTFRAFLRESSANWCSLVVNAVAERMSVVGFRFGSETGGADAWAIWQANQLDADAELVQTDALVTGSSFVLVQPDDDNPTGVSITAESPLEATVLYQPGNRRRRVAGYKRFGNAKHERTEILILPDVIATWYPRAGEPVIEPNPAGEVGMVEIVPQPRTFGFARSEIGDVMAIQDRINTTLFARLVATDYGAFRQIWATGVKMARETIGEAEDGTPITRPVRPYDVGANRLLTNERPEGRFGSIPESTLGGYLASVEQDVHQLAAISQTPPHYLLGVMINLSADAIKAAEAGLVAKVRRRMLHVGEGWEETARVALRMTGNPAAADVSAEVIWSDPETRSEGQRVDALVKMRTLGVPIEVLWQRWGASPQEVERWRALSATEQAAAAASAATAFGAPDAAYAKLLAAAGGAAP